MRSVVCAVAVFTAIPIGSVFAAEMPVKAPPAPTPPYNWTGFYLGAEVGGAWATQQVTNVTGPTAFPAGTVDRPADLSGPLGGIYGGANYEFYNHVVIGIDGDFIGADLDGRTTDISTVNGNVADHTDHVDWIATVTGRLGYAWDNWLVYGKGGAAWAHWTGSSDTYNAAQTVALAEGSSSSTRDGWTAGGGVEYGFTPNITIKVEYDYVGFDTTNFMASETPLVAAAGSPAVYQRSATSSLNMVKVGMAYKF
jgi:outer membrane immunogenic protein